MKEFVLEDQEIKKINAFLEKAKDNKALAAVYISAFEDEKDNNHWSELVVIERPRTFSGGEFESEIVVSPEDIDALEKDMEELKGSLSYPRIHVEKHLRTDYSYGLMHVREKINARSIISSTILLDRGNFREFAEQVSSSVLPWANVIGIANIDSLVKDDSTKSFH